MHPIALSIWSTSIAGVRAMVTCWAVWVVCFILAVTSGCSSVPLKEGGMLSSYGNLGAPKGKFSKSRVFLDKDKLKDVKKVAIWPTTLTLAAGSRIPNPKDRLLVSNSIDRAICFAMSEKYQIVPIGGSPDLTVKAVITDIVPTQPTVAGAATAISIGSSIALPVQIPRLPLGLGGLAVEAEALDGAGVQRAAILWSRGANSITNKARISKVGDAYDLAAAFGSEFSRMIIAGKEPGGLNIRLPSFYEIRTGIGGKPGSPLCESFGRSPGVIGALGASFGAPPSWTDKGARASSFPAQASPSVKLAAPANGERRQTSSALNP
ncbi:DUF3313 domain-containing protein [Rhizobium sp. BR 314]|uniref:DUF3313 domain-containing protein n=1 Tax=Rhizobium sp. BR 314 TaxID=3040013 RepID=UPI0039BFE903